MWIGKATPFRVSLRATTGTFAAPMTKDWRSHRREPTFGSPSRDDEFHALPDDRLDPPPRRTQSRGGPAFDAAPQEPSRMARKSKSKSGGEAKGGKAARGKARRRGGFSLGRLGYWGLVAGVWACIGLAGLVIYHAAQLPPIDQLAIPKRPPNIAILGEDGALLANRGDTGGAAIHLAELPPYVPKAFIAIEDRRFHSHFGIDPIGIARALSRNLLGKSIQGGSTITQQLAKNLFLTQERTMSRKAQEAILAIWLEHRYSKDQILELYLNRVYFGSGAYGVEAAARKYFGHGARALTLPEAAVLAGLMKAPTKLAPNRNPEGASERAAQVITAMAQEGHITEAMAKLALARPAEAQREAGAGSINYAADHVMDVLDETVGAIDEDIVVTTTLNPVMQAAGEKALTDELDAKGAKFGVSQGALVALDPNGAIKALVGGRNYSDSQFNRAIAAKRQPGSAFKPFVYLAALEQKGLTPDTLREDAPLNVRGWQPENYSREYFGAVSLTKALAMSLNTVAVRLGLEVGAKSVAQTARRLGIASPLQANPTIALGTSEVTPLELVTAYAPFANGGIGVQAHIITRVRTADGKQLYARKGSSHGRIIEPQYVAMMNAMMSETLSTGTARKAELPGWQAAGKTGTSQDFRDAWFVGYTSHLVAGVWLGNDDNSPTKKASGSNLPVEVWSRFMKAAHRGAQVAALPSGAWRAATPTPPEHPGGLPMRDPASGQTMEPFAARPTPPAPVGQPMTINRAAERAAPPPATRPPRGINDLLPPAPIPEPERRAPRDAVGSISPPPEKNFFEKLFGD